MVHPSVVVAALDPMDLMSAARSRSEVQLPSEAALVLTTSETVPSGAYSAMPTVACFPVQPVPETVKDVLVLAETKVFSWVILKLLPSLVLPGAGVASAVLLGAGVASAVLLGAGLLELLGLFRLELLARAGEAMSEAPVIAATALAAAKGRPRRMCPPRSDGGAMVVVDPILCGLVIYRNDEWGEGVGLRGDTRHMNGCPRSRENVWWSCGKATKD